MQHGAKKELRGAPDPQSARLVALLAAVAGGDHAAFRALYDETSPKLFGLALRLLRRRDLAADAVQETFLGIWRRAATYRPERGAPMAWLVSILRYRAIDRLRRRPQEAVELPADTVDGRPSPYDWTATSEDGRRLRRCLDTLDEKPRAVIVLAFVEGLTHDELARRIDSPVGTVKSWIRRGLKRLKDCLGGVSGDG